MPRVKELLGGRSNLDLRNYIINGAFDHWQRGTSFAINTFTYSTDRFISVGSGDGGTAATGTLTRQALAAGTTGVEDQEYFVRVNNTSVGSSLGVNSYYVFSQRIEDVRTLSGKTVTVSVWMAASTAKQVAIYCNQTFGTGGSPSVSINCSANGIKTLTSTVTRYDFTISVPSVSGKTIGVNSYVEFGLFLQAGATVISNYGYPTASLDWGSVGNVDIVRFQLVEGNVVGVPFSRAGGNVGGELALCFRYYETGYLEAASGAPGSGQVITGHVLFRQRKRISNSVMSVDDNQGNAGKVTLVNASGAGSVANVVIAGSGVGFDFYRATAFMTATTNGIVFNWAANAEL